MQEPDIPVLDRRLFDRNSMDFAVKYRTVHEEVHSQALLENASARGLLLWMPDDLEVGVQLEVLVESEFEDEEILHLFVEVVRREQQKDAQGRWGYGCERVAVRES